jgi:hypothetical protein
LNDDQTTILLASMSLEHTLQDEFTVEGHWRLPHWGPGRRVHGSLVFSPKSEIRLNFAGSSLEEIVPPKPGEHLKPVGVEHKVVLGITPEGRRITLLSAAGATMNFPFPPARSSYRVTWAVFGEHLTDRSQWKYTHLHARFFNLEEFVGGLPFSKPHLIRQDSFEVKFEAPKSMRGRFGEYSIETEHLLERSDASNVRVKVSHTAWIKITASSETDFMMLFEDPLLTFGHLLDLAAGTHLPLLSIVGEHADSDGYGVKSLHAIEIFFQPPNDGVLPRRRPGVALQPGGLAFSLRDFEGDFDKCLGAWYGALDRFGSIFQLFFGGSTTISRDTFPDAAFLVLASALEAYHEATHETCTACASVHETRKAWREQVLEQLSVAPNISSDASSWVASTLASTLRPAFAKRLEELYDEQPSLIQEKIGDKRVFIELVRRIRNQLAHGSRPYDAERTEPLFKVIRATRHLRLMVSSILLGKLQMPSKSFERAITLLDCFR